MSPDKEIELLENVARIGEQVKSLDDKLSLHMLSDTENFSKLNATLEKLDAKLDTLTDADNVAKGAAKTKAFMWSLVTSGGLIAVWQLCRSVLGIH